MSIRLIALDMDGTTLRNDHFSISRRNRLAILRALAEGVWVVPATGRTLSEIPRSIRRIPLIRYAIISNGSRVVDLLKGKDLVARFIEAPIAAKALEVVAELPVYTEIYCDGKVYAERNGFFQKPANVLRYVGSLLDEGCRVENLAAFVRERDFPVEKIELMPVNPVQEAILRKRLKTIPLSFTTSGMGTFEITNQAVSKGNALACLCEKLNIKASEVMAIGDNRNDLEMLRWAGLSVAVENAEPSVLAAADFVTRKNSRDGAALAIEQYVLQEGKR